MKLLCFRCHRKLVKLIKYYHTSIGGYRLVEVGKLDTPRVPGEGYETGQNFLHKVFSYRGLVLYPWKVRVFDRDVCIDASNPEDHQEKDISEDVDYSKIKNLTAEVKLYYTTLMDMRDMTSVRSFPQALTYLDNGSPCTLRGVDYVSHDDIVPYVKTTKDTFRNDHLPHFLFPTNGEMQDVKLWQETANRWLDLSQVHCQTSNGVRVTVIPFYIGKGSDKGKNLWRYSICVQSLIQDKFQLVERHWKICHSSGELQTVRGRGVVGQEPKFSSAQPAFRYSSCVELQSPTGHMWYDNAA